VTWRPQYAPFAYTEQVNHGLSPPKRHGVHATGNCCFTLAQSSPSRRFRYFRVTRCRSVSTLIDATLSPSCLQAHENRRGDRRQPRRCQSSTSMSRQLSTVVFPHPAERAIYCSTFVAE